MYYSTVLHDTILYKGKGTTELKARGHVETDCRVGVRYGVQPFACNVYSVILLLVGLFAPLGALPLVLNNPRRGVLGANFQKSQSRQHKY